MGTTRDFDWYVSIARITVKVGKRAKAHVAVAVIAVGLEIGVIVRVGGPPEIVGHLVLLETSLAMVVVVSPLMLKQLQLFVN